MAYSNDEFIKWIMKRDFESMKKKIDEERNTKNYFRFTDFSLIFRHYAYIDVADYYADEYLKQRKIFVVFGKEATHPDHGYRVIFCKVPKWQEHKFEMAMEELKHRMLICGHTDYLEFCGDLAKKMMNCGR